MTFEMKDWRHNYHLSHKMHFTTWHATTRCFFSAGKSSKKFWGKPCLFCDLFDIVTRMNIYLKEFKFHLSQLMSDLQTTRLSTFKTFNNETLKHSLMFFQCCNFTIAVWIFFLPLSIILTKLKISRLFVELNPRFNFFCCHFFHRVFVSLISFLEWRAKNC